MFHLFGVKETEIFSIYTKGERYMLCEFNIKKRRGNLPSCFGQVNLNPRLLRYLAISM